MKPSIFITGISGFVGRTLFGKLNFDLFDSVYMLIPESDIPESFTKIPNNVKILKGDISDKKSYESVLDKTDTVLYMAAITGKAKESEYEKINFKAFEQFVEISESKGVKNILFVSTIAVKFKKRKRYFYSFTKEKAENVLKKSSLNYSIFRPTMILGDGSPVFKGFSMFAGLPIIPLFGGGKAVVQPVNVDDISDALIYTIENSVFKGEIYEIGGPDKITIKDFLKMISITKGKDAKFLPIPMWIPVSVISLLERIAYSVLPLTLGQLATFRNDSVAEDNLILRGPGKKFIGIEKMVSESVTSEKKVADIFIKLKECRVYTKYLIGENPTPYVEKKYLEFLEKVDTDFKNGFDKLLSGLSVKTQIFTKICDGYSRFFFPHSTLRKKLGYLFAILETSPITYKYIDDIGSKKLFSILFSLSIRGFWMVFHLLISVLFFLPLQVLLGRGKTETEGEKVG